MLCGDCGIEGSGMHRGTLLLLAALPGSFAAAFPNCGEPPLQPASNAVDSAAAVVGEEAELLCVRQGLEGHVMFWQGDFMPPGSTGTITPVEREMCIHEPTRLSDVTQVGNTPFYSEIRSTLVARRRSDAAGWFRVALPPGVYSMFVREGELFYANGFAGEYIYPVTVARHRWTLVRFDITYLATF